MYDFEKLYKEKQLHGGKVCDFNHSISLLKRDKIQIEAQSNKHFFANTKCIWNRGGKLEFRKQIPPSLNLFYVSGISFKYSVRSLFSCSSAQRRELNSRSNRLKNSKKSRGISLKENLDI